MTSLSITLSGLAVAITGQILLGVHEAYFDEAWYHNGTWPYLDAGIVLSGIGAFFWLFASPGVFVGAVRWRRAVGAERASLSSRRSLSLVPLLGPTSDGGLSIGLSGAF